MKKKYFIALLPISFFGIIFFSVYVQAANSSQTISINVSSDDVDAIPGVYYYQLDNGKFRADLGDGTSIEVENGGTDENPVPQTTQLWHLFNFNGYIASTFYDADGNKYSKSQLATSPHLNQITYTIASSYKGIEGPYIQDAMQAYLVTKTGSAYSASVTSPIGETGKRLGTNFPKLLKVYHTPVVVNWKGTVSETKEIQVREDATLTVGQTQNLFAEVRTKFSGGIWSSFVDVSSRSTETTWSSSNSAVASVTSTGKVTAKAIGTTTVTARWNNGEYDIQASAVVNVTNEDFLQISGSPNACVGDAVQLAAQLTKKDGTTSDVTNHPSLYWTSSNTSLAVVNNAGSVTTKGVGTVTITADYSNVSQMVYESDTFELKITDCTVQPPEEPEPDPDDNIPPVAIIKTLYNSYKAGDRVIYYGDSSYDPDAEPNSLGEIENNGIRSYSWDEDPTAPIEDLDRGEDGDLVSLYYMKEGYYDMGLRVRDRDGAYGETVYPIQITPPTIEAKVLASGSLKENRHVILKSEIDTPTKFPLIPEKTVWTIKPLDGQVKAIGIRGKSELEQTIELTGVQKLDALFKEEGAYEVTLHVENTAGYTYDTNEVVTSGGYEDPYLYIDEDYKPIADFSTIHTIYRDVDNDKKATLKLTDKSISEDDVIAQRIWSIRFDSDNDSDFSDEESTVINDANETYLEYEVDKVGKYEISLKVIEEFAQPTLDEFVTPEDRMRDDTSDLLIEKRVVEVENLAPVVGFEALPRKKVSLDILLGETSQGDKDDIQTELNNTMVPKLAEKGIDISFNFESVYLRTGTDDRVKVGEDIADNGVKGHEVYFFHDDKYIYAEIYIDRSARESSSGHTYSASSVSFEELEVNGQHLWDGFGNLYSGGAGYNSTGAENVGTNKYKVITKVADITHKNTTVTIGLVYNSSRSGGSHHEHSNATYSFTAEDYIGLNLKYAYSKAGVTEIESDGDTDGKKYSGSAYVQRNYSGTTWQQVQFYAGFDPKLYPPESVYALTWDRRIDIDKATTQLVMTGGGAYLTFYGPSEGGGMNTLLTNSFKTFMSQGKYASWLFKAYYTGSENRYNAYATIWRYSNDGDHHDFELASYDLENPNKTTTNLNRTDGVTSFLGVIEDEALSQYGQTFIRNTLQNNDNYTGEIPLITLGTPNNQSQFATLIQNNANVGTFINNDDLQPSIDKMADYIIQMVNKDNNNDREITITLEDTVAYNTFFSDSENDPKFADRWKYLHDENYYENSLGKATFHDTDLTNPIEQFDRVGRYQVHYSAQDDPLERFEEMGLDPSQFEEYRKWAKEVNDFYINVHRKPVAYFEPYMKSTTGGIMINDKSYDLDKQSLPENGIKTKQWSYRQLGNTTWTSGKPTTLDKTKTWEIRQFVTDYQGATDEYIATVQGVTEFPNSPPVADFVFDKPFYYIGDTINVTSKASDPDGDTLTYSYEIISPSGLKANKTVANFSYPTTEIGQVTVKQTVTDPYGLSDSIEKNVPVLDQIIEGQVNHTDQWLINLQKFNAKYPIRAFNLDPTNGLVEFIPGEKFMLTSTETEKATSIDVFIQGYELNFGTTSLVEDGDTNIWNGSLWDETMIETFEDEEILNFVFTATFENGWVDTDEVQVKIKDDPYWRQHTSY